MIPQFLSLSGPLLAATQPLSWTLQSRGLNCSSLCNSTLLVVCFFVNLDLLALAPYSSLSLLLCSLNLPHGSVESSYGHSWVSQTSLSLLLSMLSHISKINSPPPYLEAVMSFSFPFYFFFIIHLFQDVFRLWQFDRKMSPLHTAFPFLFLFYSFCILSTASPLFSHTSPSPLTPNLCSTSLLVPSSFFSFQKRAGMGAWRAWEHGTSSSGRLNTCPSLRMDKATEYEEKGPKSQPKSQRQLLISLLRVPQ